MIIDQYQEDMLNETNSYKDKSGLPLDVHETILPVYYDLCKREKLSKCLHGRHKIEIKVLME